MFLFFPLGPFPWQYAAQQLNSPRLLYCRIDMWLNKAVYKIDLIIFFSTLIIYYDEGYFKIILLCMFYGGLLFQTSGLHS